MLYRSSQQYDEVERLLHRAGQLDPQSHDARIDLASLYIGLRQAEPAARVCKELVELDPENATYHQKYGNMLFRMGQTEKAILSYNESIRLRSSAETYAMLAEALLATQFVNEAREAMDKAISLEPQNNQWKQLSQQWFGAGTP